MTNGTRIASKILEVSTVEVKYKKADNPDGPTFVTSRVDVAFIKYMNGTTDTLNTIKQKVAMKPVVKESPKLYQAGSKYMFGDERISQNQMYAKLLSMNDPKLSFHVKKAKVAKGIQYIGFLGIPALAGGVGYSIFTAITSLNSSSGITTINSTSADYTPGIVLGVVGIACLTTSTVFKISYKSHTKAAVKMYNEKY